MLQSYDLQVRTNGHCRTNQRESKIQQSQNRHRAKEVKRSLALAISLMHLQSVAYAMCWGQRFSNHSRIQTVIAAVELEISAASIVLADRYKIGAECYWSQCCQWVQHVFAAVILQEVGSFRLWLLLLNLTAEQLWLCLQVVARLV